MDPCPSRVRRDGLELVHASGVHGEEGHGPLQESRKHSGKRKQGSWTRHGQRMPRMWYDFYSSLLKVSAGELKNPQRRRSF